VPQGVPPRGRPDDDDPTTVRCRPPEPPTVPDAIEVSTVVYIPPSEVYAFLEDFPRYARYSKHLTDVRQHGDGGPGTEYDLVFEWWKLTYTARSRVTATDEPRAIDWRIVKDLDAEGHWYVDPLEASEVPEGESCATRVRMQVDFRPETANPEALGLPRFVSLGWVIDKVKPKVQEEAERVVRRIVEDLEGETREIDLEIHRTPDSV
jgi:SH3-like domain-containing protein